MKLALRISAPLALALPVLAAPQDDAPAKLRASSLDDLPPRTYTLALPMGELVASDAEIRALAGAVAADLDDVFARYDLVDTTLDHELAQAALHAALAREDWDGASRYLARVRSLEAREDLRVVGGMHFEAWIDVRRSGGDDLEALREPFAARLRALVDAQPWDLVRHEIGRRAAKTGMLSRGLLDMAMASTLGPAAKGGPVDGPTAHRFLMLVNGVRVMLPLKDEIQGAYVAYLEANGRALTNVWDERQVALDPGAGGTPVLVAVWDTGVDVGVFGDSMWTNPREVVDRADNDGNGVVDDLHGIAFGPDLMPTTELLYPRNADDAVWARVREHDEGLSDLMASIDSPAAQALRAHLAALDGEAALAFVNDLSHYAVHSHGTHVAGIAVDGNPFARLVVARVGLDHRDPGEQKTLAWAHRFAAMCHDTVDYFRATGVRVVNMSWGWGIAEIEENLRATGFRGTDEECRARARAIHAVVAMGIEAALASAPEILFVCGAGNSGADSSEDRFVPSALDLPNLVTVGGVDRACEMTAFTSFGEHVDLYANGFHVESYVPGGERRPQSGTSMASPQVANLAVKLLALDPGMTPERVVDLMERTARPKSFAGREVLVLDPRAAVERLRARSSGPGPGGG